jgi:predicted transposase
VLLVRQLKLVTTPEQATLLLQTMRATNAACDHIAHVGREAKTSRRFDLHRLVYADIRATFGLSAQVACLAIAKVAGAFARDRATRPKFAPLGAVTYDSRVLSLKNGIVSIWTIAGRQKIRVQQGPHRIDRIDHEADLVYRDGEFYAGHADRIAAVNIRTRGVTAWTNAHGRGDVNRPDASRDVAARELHAVS